ncbi:4-hydroxy-tetrahydrodipicolinate reductase [uncultured Clostridium sp.]|uniref:4-hydroxy-tetrahydrodipicolinate reductase n=1 Tax=uncultured Clostridium sp. TaxID=59620 RepID=UPI00260F48E0|nr:4-hydroxy-tetrahydrodipicolinate reductase [uncultured Clostridium sp.]
MVKILLSGCLGKMGATIINIAKTKFNNLEIVAGFDRIDRIDGDFPIFSELSKCNVDYDVLIDFSRAEALPTLLSFSKETKKPIILCSTGYTPEDLSLIEEATKGIPIFKSANMSIGVNVVNNILKKVSSMLYDNFDIEIIEKHHNQKVDAPSGTALLLATTVQDAIKDKTEIIYGREGTHKREKEEICVHTVRGGGIIGDHDVIFAGDGEVIEISHKAISRDVFALGALKAAVYMSDITKAGKYDMDNVLNLEF